MRALFVGLGSIGSRHARDLSALLRAEGRDLRVEALRSSDSPLPPDLAQLVKRTYRSPAEVGGGYDAIFICNPTSLHYDTLQQLKGRAAFYFIEKPVFVDASRPVSSLSLPEDSVYYVACPLRFSPALQRIREIAAEGSIASVRAICSSYLPDWRPGTDYRRCYSARKELGGGVRLDLIHELDYLCWLFGRPEQLVSLSGRYGSLEADVEDIALYLARYPDMLMSLQIDYLGKPTRRAVELLFKSGETVVGDIAGGAVRFLHSGVLERHRPVEDLRLSEMRYFIKLMDGEAENINPIDQAFSTLELALR